MEENGKITSRKISENEFSYEWNFCKVKNYFSNRSPTFGTICDEFSNCYLETVYDISKSVMIFSLIGCDTQCAISGISLKTLIQEKFYLLKSCRNKEEGDFKSSMKTSEFRVSHHLYLVSKNFVFTLQVKMHKDFNTTSKPSLLLQKNENHNKFSLVPVNEESTSARPYLDNPKELIQDLRSFYTSGSMCDLEICIDEDILGAHKFILCARSPVFMKMMEHDCLESSTNSITITDCSALPFKKFLMYLYTGEIEDSTMDTVMPLYSLGDKYDVPALRKACSNILQNKLCGSVNEASNIVCDVLQLAEFHNDSTLKDLAVDFIVNHFPVVSNQQNWKDMMNSNFELISEILALVVTACQKLQT